MDDKEDKVYCFVCHQELFREMLVFVVNVDDEMICLCRDHIEEYRGGVPQMRRMGAIQPPQ